MTTNADARQPALTDLAAAVDAASDPLTRLDAVRALTDALATVERAAVAQARAGHASWADVGTRLGVSKQAAAKRFGEPRPATAAMDSVGVAHATPVPRTAHGWVVTTPRGRTLLRVVKRW